MNTYELTTDAIVTIFKELYNQAYELDITIERFEGNGMLPKHDINLQSKLLSYSISNFGRLELRFDFGTRAEVMLDQIRFKESTVESVGGCTTIYLSHGRHRLHVRCNAKEFADFVDSKLERV